MFDFEVFELIDDELGSMMSDMDTILEDDGSVLLTLYGQDCDVGWDFDKIVEFLETRDELSFDVESSPSGGSCYSWSAEISIVKN